MEEDIHKHFDGEVYYSVAREDKEIDFGEELDLEGKMTEIVDEMECTDLGE